MQDTLVTKPTPSGPSLQIVVGGLGFFLAVSGIAALVVACVFCPPVILPLLGIMKISGGILSTYGSLLIWGALSFRTQKSTKSEQRHSTNFS